MRYRHRHHQTRDQQHQQAGPHGDALGVEPVGHPGGVDPDPPDREQQHGHLQHSRERQIRDQRVRELRHREHEHKVEEELDRPDAAGVGPITLSEQWRHSCFLDYLSERPVPRS
jgi:hypothetical protein